MKDIPNWSDENTCAFCIHYSGDWCWRLQAPVFGSDTTCEHLHRNRKKHSEKQKAVDDARQLLEQLGFRVTPN